MDLQFEKERFLMNIFSDVHQVNLKLIYVDMTDDLVAGLLLSQIVYWHTPSRETGRTKLRVKKEGQLWLAKKRTAWHEECRISPKQYDRAIKILEKMQLVEVHNWMFKHKGDNMPSRTPHIRIKWDIFLLQYRGVLNEQYQKAMDQEEAENESYPQEDINNSHIENESIPNKNTDEPYSDMVITERGKTKSPKGKKRSYPKGENVFTQRGTTITETTNKDYYTENTSKDVVNQEPPLTKKLIDTCNEFYSEFAPGRWSKKQWVTIIQSYVEGFINDNRIHEVKDLKGYIKASLKGIAYKHDLKFGKIQPVFPRGMEYQNAPKDEDYDDLPY